MKEMMINHQQEITKYEKNDECEKSTFWESMDSTTTFTLCDNSNQLPLSDPNKT